MEKKSFMKKLTGSREALLAVILVLLFVVITIISPSFLTFKSLTDMLKNNAVTMVMSLGMLCVMLNIINLRKKWKGICSQVPFIVLKYRQGCI